MEKRHSETIKDLSTKHSQHIASTKTTFHQLFKSLQKRLVELQNVTNTAIQHHIDTFVNDYEERQIEKALKKSMKRAGAWVKPLKCVRRWIVIDVMN